jgi:FkbM family methyltransferase
LPTIISYAQNREDVWLARVFKDQKRGFYVDIGAAHPVWDSVTKYFYDQGWTGVNVEPWAASFNEILFFRPRDINLQVAVSNFEGTAAFHGLPENPALSSLSSAQVAKHGSAGAPQSVDVPVTTLNRLFEIHVGDRQVDFLKIDVEGYEKEVIEGGDFKKFRPKVIIVEATLPNTQTPSHEAWEPLLLRSRYVFAFFDGLNRYYLREEDKHLATAFVLPLNVFDDFQPFEVVELQKVNDELKRKNTELQSTVIELESRIKNFQQATQSKRRFLGKLFRRLKRTALSE